MAEPRCQGELEDAEKAAQLAELVRTALAEGWTLGELWRAAEPFFAAPEGVTFADTNTGTGSD